jgi:hypothetical protein
MRVLVAYEGRKGSEDYDNVVRVSTSGHNGNVVLKLGDKDSGESIKLTDVSTTTVIED